MQKYSLEVNGNFKLQEVDLDIAAEKMRVEVDENDDVLLASNSRIAPTDITKLVR